MSNSNWGYGYSQEVKARRLADEKERKRRKRLKSSLMVTLLLTVGIGGAFVLLIANGVAAYYFTPFVLFLTVPPSLFVYIWSVSTLMDEVGI